MTGTVAVIGAGVMGGAMAQVLATAGVRVELIDRDAAQLERAARTVLDGRFGLRRAASAGKLGGLDADGVAQRIRYGTSMAPLAGVDLVIEAIPEVLDAKTALLRDVDERVGAGCILASNTSGLSIAALAAATRRPTRVVGWHWSSPAQLMRLAEIVRTPDTDDDAVQAVCELARRCGKNPVVVRDSPAVWGFVANRVLRAAPVPAPAAAEVTT